MAGGGDVGDGGDGGDGGNDFVEADCEAAGGNLNYVGDGWCDSGTNNTEVCGFDGGDCCESTCDPDAAYACGSAGYECADPNVSENGSGDGGDTGGDGELPTCGEGL